MSGISREEKIEIKKKSHRQLMWIGIFSIMMMFGGLSSAYIVLKSNGTWVKIFLPDAFFVSTAIIIVSSITYFLALTFMKKGKHAIGIALTSLTLVLGLAFTYFQWEGWTYLTDHGNRLGGYTNIRYLVEESSAVYGEDYILVQNGNELNYFDGKFYDKRDVNYAAPVKDVALGNNNNASSFLYILTGLHVLHLLGGLISLLVVLIKSVKKRYAEEDYVGIKVSAIYWHFLDFLWLYLLGLLYFVG